VEEGAVPVTKFTIPEELKDRIPNSLLHTIKFRWYGYALVVGLSCLALGIRRNGWIYFLGAIVGPILFGLYLIFFPLRLYRTPAAKFSGMADLDTHDPVARRLVNLMSSADARSFLAHTAVKLAILLLFVMSAIAALLPQPLGWNLNGEDAEWFLMLTFCCAIFTFPIYATELLLWSLRNWEQSKR
jgi:hypothetical protein